MPDTVKIAPTWVGLLPLLLEVATRAETQEARDTARAELRRMAQAADKAVALGEFWNPTAELPDAEEDAPPAEVALPAAPARTYQDADGSPLRFLADYDDAVLRREIELCDAGLGNTIGHQKRDRFRIYRRRLWAELMRRNPQARAEG